MNKYIIGIDAGGTKTIGVLFDIKAKELKRVESTQANFAVDEINATNVIIDVIQQLFVSGDNIIIIGAAGSAKMKNKHEFENKIEKIFYAKTYLISDAVLAMYSIIKNDLNNQYIMALSGTGSAIVTYNGQVKLLGGYGHILGDEGSAWNVSLRATKNIINRLEYGVLTPLDQILLKKMQVDNGEGIIQFVYNNPKTKLAALAKVIAKEAQNDNFEAKELLKTEGELLAKQVISVYQKMDKNQSTIIGFRGSFIQNNVIVQKAFKSMIEIFIANIQFENTNIDPVFGAYYLGLKYIK